MLDSGTLGAALTMTDLDGDGWMDYFAGDSTHEGRGRVVAMYGPISGTIDMDTDADLTLSGVTGQGLGGALGAGDLDADGYPDLVVGSCATAACPGEALIWFGGSAK